ncbi:ABC transporter substrate-binding protein [Pyrobaculum calidifontis]|uniref:ABC transporter substrate-binding protein n=1 Tax=Pyrobaculum calidifontis TaxID=181486 RepID=UPI0003224014|nr:ABC transporter substrate-binding protein [Pyrobaculum calidifontis]
MSRTGLIVSVVVILIILGVIVAWLASQGAPPATPTPAPTQTASPTPTPTPAPAKVKIRIWGPWSGAEYEYFKQVLDEYQRLNPNVEFEYVTRRAEDIAQILPTQLEARQAPADVIFTSFGWFVVEMAKRGHLVDLTNVVNEAEFVPGILDGVKYDGKIWAAPFTMSLKPGFWYRKSFFQRYGLSEPQTWDEFVQLLEKLKGVQGVKAPIASGDGVGWPLSDVTEAFIIAYAGPDVFKGLIDGSVKFTDPRVVAVFRDRLVPLLKKGYFGEPTEWTAAVQQWWNGEYGIYFMGTWILGMVDNPDDVGFFPMPETRGITGGTDYIFVPKYSPNVEAAVEFVKWLATKGQEVHASTKAGKVPSWLKADPNKIWPPLKAVYEKTVGKGMVLLPDLDDSVGGDWQKLFWDQLKLLWVQPDKWQDVVNTLAANFPAK